MLFMEAIQKVSSFLEQIILSMLHLKKVVYFILGLPLLLMSGYLFIHYAVYPLWHIPWSRVHLLTAPFAELLLIFLLTDLFYRTRSRSNKFVFLFMFFLLNFVGVLFLANYYNQVSQDVLVVTRALFAAPILLAVLFAGAVVFFVLGLGEQLKKIWLHYSLEAESESAAKDRMSKTLTVCTLLGVFILGLGLRLYNLDGFPPYVDEYIHTNWAFLVYSGQPIEWGRAFLTVNLPVYLSYLTFGVNLWAGRFPMVFINMLSIFPLYVLGSRVNRQIGFICVALFSLSPWIIASSRTVRDYAVVPLIFYTAAVLLIDLLGWEGLRLREYLQKNKYRILLAAGILVYTVIDKTSILRIILGVYGVFGALALFKILKKDFSRYYKAAILALGSGFFVFLLIQSRIIYRIQNSGTLFYRTVTTYWSTLVDSEMHQWYSIGAIGYLVLLVGAFFAIRALARAYSQPDFSVLFLFLAFSSHLFYLTYVLSNPRIPGRMRYGVLMEYWYLPLVALFLWLAYDLGSRFLPKAGQAVVAALLIVLFTNPLSVLYVINYQGGLSMQLTGENHYLSAAAHEFLATRLTERDVLLSDFMHNYDNINGQRFRSQGNFSYYKPVFSGQISPLGFIEENPQGWIAVSANARPASYGLAFEDFIHVGKHIRYFGQKGDIYLWQWSENAGK
jgi:hypothetical protein